ncbi:hypothetical protein [Rubrivivax sp. A210]|uniref:hypothetical protein n=1 Tax=Rubrivivax sp. A210 TaxID=2772301 RepID=UPI0019181AA6|nr:hypothetical protein [Rubrivivax sp. A210]
MLRPISLLATALASALLGSLLGACATRSAQVQPVAASAAEFAAWDCPRIDGELDRVQQRAAELAWAVDERAGNNIAALGLGVMVFWPALIAMRPDGLEAADLARLKGRDEALRGVARDKACPPAGAELPAARAAALPVAPGERLVYEERGTPRQPPTQVAMRLSALRRGEIEYEAGASQPLRHDLAGNVVAAPPGTLWWPHLLRAGMALGQITGGDMLVAGDPLARARLRGQVVAAGPQTVASRRFQVVVVELYGDASQGDESTRVDGVIVIDSASGVLLRLDLRSAHKAFNLQRRLVSVEPAP